jgi:hypothetical protein
VPLVTKDSKGVVTFHLPTHPVARTAVIVFGLLVIAGFVLAMALDAGAPEPTPVLQVIRHVPIVLRVVLYIVVGIPVGIGVMIYVIVEWSGFINFLRGR